MSIVVIVLTLLFVALLVRLVATVRADGYGVRPAPRSHHTEGPFDVTPGLERHHSHV